jgi:excisionase family DNA binding protein
MPGMIDDYPDYLTPEQVREVLGLGKNATYDALKRGDIPSVRIGRLIRVSKEALKEKMNGKGLYPTAVPR